MKNRIVLPRETTTWYDPFAGLLAFQNVLEQMGYTKVISQDLYTIEPLQDYMLAQETRHTVTIGNPPFCKKGPTVLKMFNENKPFGLIVPFDTILLASLRDILKERGALIFIPKENFKFQDVNGEDVQPVKCCYFLGNFPNPGNKVIVTHM